MSNVVQRSFAGGELAPALYARTDQVKYATGLRTCRNMMVQRHGGATNRPGAKYVCAVKNAADPVRLLKFIFNADQTYILEVGPKYIRWIHDAGQLVVSGVAAWVTGTAYTQGDLASDGGVNYYCTADHMSGSTTEPGVGTAWGAKWAPLTGTIYEIPTPYAAGDLSTLKYVQSADVITIVHPSYPPYELRREGQTRWILAPVAFGPEIDSPTNGSVTGGTADADSKVAYAITAVAEGSFEESLPLIASAGAFKPDPGDPSASPPVAPTPIVLAWDAVVGGLEYNIYRADDGRTFGFIGTIGGTPITVRDSAWDDNSDTATGTGPGSIDATGQARITLTVGDNGHATDQMYTVAAELQAIGGAGHEIDGQDEIIGRMFVYYSRDGEARVFAGASGPLEGSGTISVHVTITVPDNGYTALVVDLVPDLFILDDSSWDLTVTGQSVSWKGNQTGFSDPAIDPDFSLAPPVQQSLFDQADSYPSCTGYFQQRQLFANTNTEPEQLWASRSANFGNFSTSTPLQDDDAVRFILAGQQVNAIRHLLDLGQLIVFTSAGEHVIQGDTAGILRPGQVNPTRIASNGIVDALPPLVVDNSALYVQARGTIVRDLRNDPVNGYQGNDLTIFAQHLFTGKTLADWDYAQNPNSIIWVVRSDGVLLGLTYMPEQAIWGWHRHDTDGVVENVCVVPEGAEDRLYLVVKRTVNGATKRYIERLASRFFSDIRDAVFVDAGLSYDGRNTGATTMTLSGGVAWDNGETLTCTASADTFDSGDVGNAVHFTAADGSELRCTITAYTSATVVTVRPAKMVPVELRGVATTVWARAVDTFAGLDHLEGKDVAVLADGFVAASPNNEQYPIVAVADGSITLDRPYAVVHVGLPYVSDLQTLDIDAPQGPSLKDKPMNVNRLGIFVEASRGIWAGGSVPTGDDPLEGLDEYKARSDEEYDDPTRLITDAVTINIQNTWNGHGRVLIRQVDPLPLTVLAVIPQGFIPAGG